MADSNYFTKDFQASRKEKSDQKKRNSSILTIQESLKSMLKLSNQQVS